MTLDKNSDTSNQQRQNQVVPGNAVTVDDQDTDLNEIEVINKYVTDVTATYDPKKMSEEESEWEGEEIGFFALNFKYASAKEKCMWFSATLFAFFFGGALPGFCLVFGDMIQDVGGGSFDSLGGSAKWMVIIGALAFVCSFGFIALYSLFAVSVSNKIQVEYFKAALKKDAAYYDVHNTNQISAKIAKECQAVQRGAGDKTGLIIMGISSFFIGFGVAFYLGWFMSVLLIGIFPLMLLAGGVFTSILSATMKEQMKAYAQSAGYAEQALSAIKVVHTYGQELLEMKNYRKYL
jgi:ATP-binding cassette subfamily B (MDR/TAP) protein 1